MLEKTLYFIPYQDTDNFYEDGILTREFSILSVLFEKGYRSIINVKKPRTWLDAKRYIIHNEYYPFGTIEGKVKEICDKSETIQYCPPFSIEQILKRRAWWVTGYRNTINIIPNVVGRDVLVYSDNPFAYKLLEYLSNFGCKVFFDVMDNFAIHPSLNGLEHKIALYGYQRIMEFANVVSANSYQTCNFIKKQTGREPILVKNGVFGSNNISDNVHFDSIKIIQEAKLKYRNCAGYIGKIGLRLDEDLIDRITEQCKDTLFVFVGPLLKGQMNEKLMRIFSERENVLHIEGIPSAYVYSVLDQFNILLIPHSVGKSENGGDPLKLYQYLTRSKPIITTKILGVDEFSNQIRITNDYKDWIEFIRQNEFAINSVDIKGFLWETRLTPVISELIKL